jgi:anti-repressor protein
MPGDSKASFYLEHTMNDLIQNVRTMDSREIAELTGKRHDNVMRDIREQLGKLEGGLLRFEAAWTDSVTGLSYKCFELPYRETMILVSGYSVELRARIIDRWLELERESAPSLPKSFAEALQLAADQAKELEAKTAALALAAPKVESFDALQRSESTMSITQASKHFGLHPKTQVFPYLREMKYLTSRDLPTQSAIDAGYLALREAECSDGEFRPQAVVLTSQLETWRTRVVPQIMAWQAKV